MKRQHRQTVISDRIREIVAQVESSPNTNRLKLLEPFPVQPQPKTGNS